MSRIVLGFFVMTLPLFVVCLLATVAGHWGFIVGYFVTWFMLGCIFLGLKIINEA